MSNTFNQSTFNGDVNIITNTKRDRSPSSELSDSSVSSLEMKRSKKINYFLGEGKKNWKPKKEFLVNGINFTELFRKFRKHSIVKAEENTHINPLRILSLSHIFPLNKFDISKCITRQFDKQNCKALKSVANDTKPKIKRMSGKAVMYCKNKADMEDDNNDDDDNDDDDDNEEEKEEEEEEKEGKEAMFSMVKDLVDNRMHCRASAASSSEATFTEKYLLQTIQRVLLKDASEDFIYAMIDKPDSNKMRPDFMFGAKVRTKAIYFFFIEVKRPATTSKYQPEDDYTKLMKELKCSIDKQLCLGVLNPTSLGLLVEGFKATLFQMKLLVDGVYMPMAIDRFSLVEEIHELVHFPSVVEAFCFVKSEVGKFMEDINKKRTRQEKIAGRTRVYLSFETKFVSKKTK